MEVILSVAFGQALDVQNGQGGDLYKLALTVINAFNDDSNKSNNIAQLAIMGYPQLSPMMGKLLALSGALKPVNDLIGVSKNVVDKRRASKDQAQRNDLLQLMVEASQVEGEGAMTYEETIADCLLVLLAGYDTSSNTLAFVTYLLAVHQDVQERLATEIGNYFQDNPESSMYEASHELEYLEMVVCEALRMYPPATMTSRVCEKDCLTQGLSVRKGTLIFIPTVDIHHDPELWEDPEKFDPERFSKENKSSHPVTAYQPFGVGPRNCIGMRFAQLEIKMTLIEVLRNYRITTTPDTKIPLKETCGTFIQRPMPGEAMIGFQRRNN
jgi:cytochrome P450